MKRLFTLLATLLRKVRRLIPACVSPAPRVLQHLHSLPAQLALSAIAALLTLAAPTASYAAYPGDLDLMFGTNGMTATDFSSSVDNGYAVAIQADGKIIVAGSSQDDFALARYDANGTLDATFGTGGRVTTDFFANTDRVNGVAIQADDKILVAGIARNGSNRDFALARYNPDGTLDATFGTGGKLTTDFFGSTDSGESVTVQADGKIVVAGSARNTSTSFDFAVARYHANGTLDTTFGTSGKVTTDFGGDDTGGSVALQEDGKIVVAGSISAGGYSDFAVVRYNANGTLDTSFATAGKTTLDIGGFGSTDQATTVLVQATGKIVVVGRSLTSDNSFALVRYDANGVLDTTFGGETGTGSRSSGAGAGTASFGAGTGIVLTAVDADTSIVVSKAAVQADGKIVVAGSYYDGPSSQIFAVVRYDTEGVLDSGFGQGGAVFTGIVGNSEARSVAMQADGRIVVAGSTMVNATYDFVLMRHEGTPSLPTPDAPAVTDMLDGSVRIEWPLSIISSNSFFTVERKLPDEESWSYVNGLPANQADLMTGMLTVFDAPDLFAGSASYRLNYYLGPFTSDYSPETIFSWADTDVDGLPDAWEMVYLGALGGTPEGDQDLDGLTNLMEFQARSNPTLVDSDGDEVDDAWELAHGRNPANADDADADYEGDGVPDRWELQNGLNPAQDDGVLDADSDGLANAGEFYYHTNPNNPDSDGDGVLDGADGWPLDNRLSPPRVPETSYLVIQLGDFMPSALNNHGSVVGRDWSTGRYWSHGNLHEVSGGVPVGLDDDERLVGEGFDLFSPYDEFVVLEWFNYTASPSEVGRLVPEIGDTQFSMVSPNGTMVGWGDAPAPVDEPFPTHGWIKRPGASALEDFAGFGDFTILNGVNDAGWVVGRSGSFSMHGAVWDESGVPTILGINTWPYSINDNNDVVGYQVRPHGGPVGLDPVLWLDGLPVNLPMFREWPLDTGEAYRINNHTQIVGWIKGLGQAMERNRAILWQNGRVIDLNSRIRTLNLNLVMRYGIDIKDDGMILAEASPADNLFSISKAVLLVPIEVQKLWSDQLTDVTDANYLPNKTGQGDRPYLLMGACQSFNFDLKGHLKAKVKVGGPEEIRNRILWRLASVTVSGDLVPDEGTSAYNAEGDEVTIVLNHPRTDDENSYYLVAGYDYDWDGQLSQPEVSFIPTYKWKHTVNQKIVTEDRLFEVTMVSRATYDACVSDLTSLAATWDSMGLTQASRMMTAYLTQTTPVGATPEAIGIARNEKGLTHAVGVLFTPPGGPGASIKAVFPPTSTMSQQVVASGKMFTWLAGKIAERHQHILTRLSTSVSPTETFNWTFPESDFPFSPFVDLDLLLALGKTKFKDVEVEVVINSSTHVGRIESVIVSGIATDLYDFDYDGYFDWVPQFANDVRKAARVQAGYNTIGNAGRVFRSEVRIENAHCSALEGQYISVPPSQ